MGNIHKKQWLLGGFLCAIFLAFFFGWLGVNQNITMPEANGWLFPIIFFSLGVTSLCLVTLTSKEKSIVSSATILAFAPSLFFVQDIRFILLLCIGVGLSIIGLLYMRQDMDLHIRIRVRRIMQHGIGWLVIAFSLVIASFYYMQIRYVNGEELLQKLSIDQTSHVVLTKALGLMNPAFKKANQENVTVDEFLLNFQQNQSMSNEEVPVPSDSELLQMAGLTPSDPRAPEALKKIKKGLSEGTATINTQALVLEQGRKQLSGIVGKPLSGKEPIADILSQIIDQRIRTYFKPDAVDGSASILPFILSVILFVTLWSLGSFLGILWRFLTAMAFGLLCSFGSIKITRVSVEQEVIE